MNMIDDALSWFNNQRNTHLTEEVIYITADGQTSLHATIIEPASSVSSTGLKIRTDKVLFIVNAKDVDFTKIRRGNKFTRPNYGTYEVVTDRANPPYYNDPNQVEIVIPVKHVTN